MNSDIQPANVLISFTGHDRIERVLLADFGVAAFVEADGTLPTMLVGSTPFMAPELNETRERYHAYKADGRENGVET